MSDKNMYMTEKGLDKVRAQLERLRDIEVPALAVLLHDAKDGGDLDSCHYEFEDDCPDLGRYHKWSRLTFLGTVIGMLLIFLTAVL